MDNRNKLEDLKDSFKTVLANYQKQYIDYKLDNNNETTQNYLNAKANLTDVFSQLNEMKSDVLINNMDNNTKLAENNLALDVLTLENDVLKKTSNSEMNSVQASEVRLQNINSEIVEEYLVMGVELLKILLILYVYYVSSKK